MTQAGHLTADEPLIGTLRSALRNLYDPAALRQSPLIALLGLGSGTDPAAALRQELIAAVHALRPQSDTPADTQLWRMYEVLLYRYVQRATQVEVADQLGLSARHLSRIERDALRELSERLFQPEPSAGTVPAEYGLSLGQEVSWLGASETANMVDLGLALQDVRQLVRPLAAQHGVVVHIEGGGAALPPLAVHLVALRQILVGSLSGAIRRMQGGQVILTTGQEGVWTWLAVHSQPDQAVADPALADADNGGLQVWRDLVRACGGEVEIDERSGGWFSARVRLPSVVQSPVLVIDDNPATLDLLRRYASGTRYRIVGTQTLPEALAVVPELSPHVIVLDVMMPDIDGWEALGRLRQHPLTQSIPVIICTILQEEELALSLGASAYLRKPLTREAFLMALDRVDPAVPGSVPSA
ncbi:MAG: response regulator [Anaerolineales bacterium]